MPNDKTICLMFAKMLANNIDGKDTRIIGYDKIVVAKTGIEPVTSAL